MATTKKSYVYKVYDALRDQNTLWDVGVWGADFWDRNPNPVGINTAWADDVVSDPRFSWGINAGPQELRVRLARNYDDFGEDDDVELNNDVTVICFDRDAPNGARVYRVFISQYRAIIDGQTEYVDVILQSYSFLLARQFLKDDDGYTALTYSSEDPSDILKDIIDKQRAAGGEVRYTASSIEDTGTTVSYTFNLYTYKEAIDKVLELCPDGWFWYIDTNNIIYLSEKASTPDHQLFVGKEISKLEAVTDMEGATNRVYFVGGTPEGEQQIYRKYDRISSITTYGTLAEKKVDHRVTLSDTADTMTERILDAKDTPQLRLFIEVVDNNGEDEDLGYDIESFSVGDVIRINNLKQAARTRTLWDMGQWDEDVWDATLAYTLSQSSQIMKITYMPDRAILETIVGVPSVPKRMEDYYRNIEHDRMAEIPVIPTIGSV